ncbi:sigma-B regulation protein RsbU (phosphoserine phosphatase) [Cyclonatronum proteinivorum]|uniref:Sigma-B regulation protein RsbU (Phosphoserine phosphatase) n=1 Tax=Cyclonatronum proteinivorum TaxID=1457365 RepID=A0A345UNL3_9BACT|nr:SpoIIE family protein phosphatase [Cyclonatronum proteinivorum]AXJ02065.1 sigma-B regulation protein RsbU (phosphoserine phosphatase) [Cyclonatronum proteinivorum]
MTDSCSKILVVDDEPDLQLLMKQKFRKKIRNSEYAFFFAEDGLQALDIIREEQEIHLILSDINMPNMDGLTFLNEVQKLNRRELKTVMVSAYGDMENIRTAMNGGAYDFVTKPIDFRDLETTIEKTLSEIEQYLSALEAQKQLEALSYDLDMAARIQQKLLRKDFPVYTDDTRFEIYAKMIAAKYVGGDFYGFFKFDKDHLVFYTGDVSGKGMPAAIYMAVCQTMLKAIGSQVLSPAEALTQVNRMLIPESDISTFVTVFYGVLNVSTGTFAYCNGGHNLPCLLKADGSVSELEDVGGLLLGKFDGMPYLEQTIQLHPGDQIVTFTDGVTEAENPSGEMYEEERLISFLQNNAGSGTDTLVNALFSEVQGFAGEAPQSDDITVLAVRFGRD